MHATRLCHHSTIIKLFEHYREECLVDESEELHLEMRRPELVGALRLMLVRSLLGRSADEVEVGVL